MCRLIPVLVLVQPVFQRQAWKIGSASLHQIWMFAPCRWAIGSAVQIKIADRFQKLQVLCWECCLIGQALTASRPVFGRSAARVWTKVDADIMPINPWRCGALAQDCAIFLFSMHDDVPENSLSLQLTPSPCASATSPSCPPHPPFPPGYLAKVRGNNCTMAASPEASFGFTSPRLLPMRFPKSPLHPLQQSVRVSAWQYLKHAHAPQEEPPQRTRRAWQCRVS